jgi:hypothetical protein
VHAAQLVLQIADLILEAGRDLKTQKSSGRLTSDNVTQDRLDIHGHINTARKHGHDPTESYISPCSETPGGCLQASRCPGNHPRQTAPITHGNWGDFLHRYHHDYASTSQGHRSQYAENCPNHYCCKNSLIRSRRAQIAHS